MTNTNINQDQAVNFDFKTAIKELRKLNKGKQLNECFNLEVKNDKFTIITNGDYFQKFIASRVKWVSGVKIDHVFIENHFADDFKVKLKDNKSKEIDIKTIIK